MRNPVARPRIKRSLIVQTLRREIITGKLRVGGRMPTRTEIEARFSAGPVTVQQALNGLATDGFVVARGSRGTFVADRPPHLSRYGMVFSSHPSDAQTWGRFAQALSKEAADISRDGARRVHCFYEIQNHSDVEDYQTLLRDIKACRLAGLIFTGDPTPLLGTPIMEEPGVPRVAIMPPMNGVECPVVQFSPTWFDEAVGALVQRGRRRLATLIHTTPYFEQIHEDQFLAACQRHGLEQPAHWRQFQSALDAKGVCHATQLLMHTSQSERPDGLIVADDNMLEAATAGLLASGVRVPVDVEVVAGCNFPWPTGSVLPVRRLGYDIQKVLKECIDLIDRQRCGETPPRVTFVAPVFEDVWRARAGAAAGTRPWLKKNMV